MPLVLADRVKDTTTTTGTGTVTLSGTPPTGFQAFSVIGNGNTTYYTIAAGSQWEVGIGTYSSTGPTLSRDTVLDSSNSGSLVNFSAGTKDVFVTYPADKSALTQVGQVVVATDPPSTGTWLNTGKYYSKATYPSLASVVGDVPDIGAPVAEPQAQLPVAFATATAPNARYIMATNGTTAVVGGTSGRLRKSTNGTTWTPVISPWVETSINEILYLNGNYVACPLGTSSNLGVTIMWSNDGTAFNLVYTGLPTSGNNTVVAAYGAGRYVVINGAASSGVAYSSDLVNWTVGSFPSTANTLRRVIFANSLFVAVGTSSCFTSSDGITWTSRTIPAGTYTDVIYANGLYVAYGSSGILSTSADGITWTSRSAGAQTFNQIIYANSLFVAVANAGLIYTSSDGVAWTLRTSGTTQAINGVCWNGSNYVAVGANGRVLTSADGVTWTVSVDGSLSTFNQVEVIDGKTVAFGTSACVVVAGATRSVPMLSGAWQYSVTTTSATNPRSVAYNGSDRYVAVGANGAVLTSSDGQAWTGRNSTLAGSLNAVFYLNGNYIAMGPSGSAANLITSADAETWTARTAGTANFNAAAFGASTYVVVGTSGAVFSSANLVTWTSQSAGAQTFNDVIFANSLFVAVGAAGTVYSSPDGVTWTSRSAGSTQFNRIIYANSLFVAVANSGVIYTSSDGTTWTLRTSNVASNLNDVAWNGSIFCAVGESGVITTSSDGTTWTARTPAGTTDLALISVAWSGTRFIVVNTTNSLALTSTDGITWTRENTSGTTGGARYAAYLGGRFIAVGTSNWIQTSTDGLTWRASDNVQYVPSSISRFLKLNNVYYALTNAGMFQSSDGISFSAVRTSLPASAIVGVAYNASTWVAVASSPTSGYPGYVLKSTDGTTWTKSAELFDSTGTGTGSISVALTDCAYANGNFVLGLSGVVVNSAIIANGVMTSADAVTWTVRRLPYSGSPSANTMASDGTTIALLQATPNTIVRSTDGGITWSLLSAFTTAFNIGYASGVWLTGGGATSDLAEQITLPGATLNSTGGFYVHNSKFVYTLADASNRRLSQVDSAPGFSYIVSLTRFAPTVANTGKEYPVRGTTLMYAIGAGATAGIPFLIAECPLYSYDTATTFWVPPQSAGGGQQAYIYAGP